jgi:hypothetical protein
MAWLAAQADFAQRSQGAQRRAVATNNLAKSVTVE